MNPQDFDNRMQELASLIGDHDKVDIFVNEYKRLMTLIKADIESDDDGGLFPVRIFRLKSLLGAELLFLKTAYTDTLYEMAGGNVQ